MNEVRHDIANWRPLENPGGQPRRSGNLATGAPSFRDALDSVANRHSATWNVSQHAQQRLTARGIHLTNGDFHAMDAAASQAEQKGARTAYMVLGHAGLVVNLPSRTVVTAMENHSNTVVTQIDSVVFVNRLDHVGGSLPVGDRPIR